MKLESFKIGDHVYSEEDFIYGKIVEIGEDVALVEFRTSGGGGCLPYSLSELKHEKWCITTKSVWDDEIAYLAWQNPGYNKHGYFWTNRKNFENILDNNNLEHPFLFDSRRAAIRHLKTIKIPQKCKIVRW